MWRPTVAAAKDSEFVIRREGKPRAAKSRSSAKMRFRSFLSAWFDKAARYLPEIRWMSLDAAVDAPCLGFSARVLAFSFSVLLAAFNASLLHVAVHRGVAEALTSVALHDFGAVRRFPDHSVRGYSEESGLHHCIHGGLVPSDFEHVKASWSAVVLSLAAAQHLCHSNVVAGGEFDFFCDLRGCVGTVDILQDASYCGHGPSGVCVSLQVHLLDDLDCPLVSLGGGWCQRVRCFTGDCRELDFLSPQSGDQSLWQNSPP